MNFKSTLWIAVLSLALLFPAVSRAQSEIDTSNIPSNAIGAFIFSLSKIKANPKLEDLPYEVLSSEFEESFGLDIFSIEQGTVVVWPGKDANSIPEVAVVLKLTEKPALVGTRIKDSEDEAGYKAKSTSSIPASILVIDDYTLMILRDSSDVEKLVNAQPGTLSKMIDKTGSDRGEAFAVLDPKSMMASYGDTIKEGAKQIPFLPPAITQLIPLLDKIEAAEASFKVEPYRFDSLLRFSDAATAAEASKKIKEAAELGAQMGVGLMASQMDTKDPIQAAGLEYSQRLIKEIPEMPNFKANGNELTFSIDEQEMVVPALALMTFGQSIDSYLYRATRNSRRSSAARASIRPMTPDADRAVKAADGAIGGAAGMAMERPEAAAGINADKKALSAEEVKKRLEEFGVKGFENAPLDVQRSLLEAQEMELKNK